MNKGVMIAGGVILLALVFFLIKATKKSKARYADLLTVAKEYNGYAGTGTEPDPTTLTLTTLKVTPTKLFSLDGTTPL